MTLSRSALTALCIAVMAFALPLTTSPAHAVNAGLEDIKGEGWEIYAPEWTGMNAQEVFIVINYGGSDITLQNVEGNVTLNVVTIAAESSQFAVLDFPDVETAYTISLLRGGEAVHVMTKERPAVTLPRPKDVWRIEPPAVVDPDLKYDEEDLMQAIAAAISRITVDIILVATVVAGVGALLGAAVKGITRFLVPKDLLSIAFFSFIFLDLAFGIVQGFDKLWYLPLVVGYILGFILWHIPYIMPIRTDCAAKSIVVRPEVVYYPDDRASPCIQAQNNVALVKRWCGIHHRLGTDAGINPDWYYSVKKPYWPRLSGPSFWIEKEQVTAEERRLWIFKVRRFETRMHLSNASQMPKYHWLQSTDAFFRLQEKLDRVYYALVQERLTRRAETAIAAGDMVSHSIGVSPMEAIREIFSRPEEPLPDIEDTGENELTVVEERASEQQEGAENEPAEEAGQPPAKPRKARAAKGRKATRKRRKDDEEEEED